MRMDATECYYLDDFMPTPDRLVTGRSSGVFLRYYNYDSAIYKIWDKDSVMLAFYSKDNRCWSLFEEYNTNKKMLFQPIQVELLSLQRLIFLILYSWRHLIDLAIQ